MLFFDHGGSELTNNFWPLVGTLCVYLIAYLIGIRLMHTYQAIIRYSSFVDLTRIASAKSMCRVWTRLSRRERFMLMLVWMTLVCQ